jgi:ABC-type Mn2+/Zn2+ transport system permease subunit
MDGAAFLSLLLEPFQYVFIRRGLIEALLMGGICGAMGAFVVAAVFGPRRRRNS